MKTPDEIFEEYIGPGQMGIDFEKKHILEAMSIHAKEFVSWIYKNTYIKNLDDSGENWMKWVQKSVKPMEGEWICKTTAELYEEYLTDTLGIIILKKK